MSTKTITSTKSTRTLISSNLFLKNIIILDQNKSYSSSYYISLIISNLFPQNSKIINFKNGKATLNQILSLKNEEPKKKYIKLELYEKDKIYSNLILKGEIINENYIYDHSSDDFVCYLCDTENEEKAVVHYNIDYDYMNTGDLYDKSVKRVEKVYKKKLKNENHINDLFLMNFQYIKLICNDIYAVLNWKNKWRTLSYLFALSFIIIFFKAFYALLLPLYLIFFHIKNKNNIENFIITRDNVDNQKNKNENNLVLFKIMFIFNKIIKIFENIAEKIINGKTVMTNLYIRMAIAFLANFCFFYFKFYRSINFKFIILSIIWFYVLRKNPSFYSFSVFLFNIVEERTLFITTNTNFYIYKTNLINFFTILIPFYSLYNIYNEEYIDNSQFVKDKDEIINNKDILKYELYENERWWKFVGWKKTLIFDESMIWYKVGKPKEYCDKNMVKLPGNNSYKWKDDWKIETNKNCDENGWEYSSDFNNNFQKYNGHQCVRRRKWIRYASKN